MTGLIFFVIRSREKHRRQDVEGQHAVGLWDRQWGDVGRWLQAGVIGLAVFERVLQEWRRRCSATCPRRSASCRAAAPKREMMGFAFLTLRRSATIGLDWNALS